MTAEIAISARGLGKRYVVGGASERQRYGALRDVVAQSLRRTGRSAIQLLRGRVALRARTEEFWALRGLDFDIPRGEVVGIIGRNGAGKSTLLKILSRITEPTEGVVELRGRVGSLLEVGTGFHPELTGRENVYLNGAVLGMTRAEIKAKFDEIVDFAGVERFLDTPVKRYSSGMYMRLAFAVAAHLEPEILIVDEVLAVGDAEFQAKCLGKMKDVADHGRTVLLVSHNLTSIQRLCKTGILLRTGRIDFAGPIQDCINAYVSRDVIEAEDGQFRFPVGAPSEFYIEQVDVLDEDGAPKPIVRTWDPVTFRIRFHAPEPSSNVAAVLEVFSEDRVRMLFGATLPDGGVKLDVCEGQNIVQCRFEHLPCAAGTFLLNFGLTVPNEKWLAYTSPVGMTVHESDLHVGVEWPQRQDSAWSMARTNGPNADGATDVLIYFLSAAIVVGGLLLGVLAAYVRRSKLWLVARVDELERQSAIQSRSLIDIRKRIILQQTASLLRLPSRMPSQGGEDIILYEFFEGRRTGFFVEVGAYDGVGFSNTYFLEALGWDGVLIEPSPEFAAACRQNRPNSQVVQAACGRASGDKVRFRSARGNATGMGTLSYVGDNPGQEARIRREGGVVESVDVDQVALSDVLAASQSRPVDLLSIDVEGAELEVLAGADLQHLKPAVILMEDNSGGRDTRAETELAASGYRKALVWGHNTFYLRLEDDRQLGLN